MGLICMKVSISDLEKIKKNLIKTNKTLVELDKGLDETPELGKIIKANNKQIKMLDDEYLNIKPHYERD